MSSFSQRRERVAKRGGDGFGAHHSTRGWISSHGSGVTVVIVAEEGTSTGFVFRVAIERIDTTTSISKTVVAIEAIAGSSTLIGSH